VNTSIYRQDTLSVAKGDKILWTRNERSSNTKNNDLFVVSGVTAKGVTLTSQPQASTAPVQKRLLVDESHHLDHAWVLTVHRAQGQTSKNVLLVADQRLTASEFLVGVTRATQNVLIIAHDKQAIENIGKKDLTKGIAHEVAGLGVEQIKNEAKVTVRDQGRGVEM
jgi:ATP-dependent exoDNAse (exonuclease V) alpha subunit